VDADVLVHVIGLHALPRDTWLLGEAGEHGELGGRRGEYDAGFPMCEHSPFDGRRCLRGGRFTGVLRIGVDAYAYTVDDLVPEPVHPAPSVDDRCVIGCGELTNRGVNTVITGRVPGGRGVRIHHSDGRITVVEPYLQVPDRWLLPGMIDLQVNGYAGLDVTAAELTRSVMHDLVRAEARCGVTAFCPTVVTAGEERIMHALAAIAAACDEDEWTRHPVLGVHVEGPYLCAEDGPRGAHDATQLRAPSAATRVRDVVMGSSS